MLSGRSSQRGPQSVQSKDPLLGLRRTCPRAARMCASLSTPGTAFGVVNPLPNSTAAPNNPLLPSDAHCARVRSRDTSVPDGEPPTGRLWDLDGTRVRIGGSDHYPLGRGGQIARSSRVASSRSIWARILASARLRAASTTVRGVADAVELTRVPPPVRVWR